MSIASEITRINDAKTSIKNSIINKGITVLDTQKIDEYSTLIDSIETKKPEQSKSVTPSESVQNITPDNGYTLSQVTIEAISKTYVGSNVTKKSAQTYTPTTTDQTIASGQYLTGTQTIKGDSNLTADNIKSGTSIFGVTGTHAGQKTEQTKTIDLSMASGNQIISPDSGKVLNKVIVNKPSTLIPANVKKDVNIGGVVGTLKSSSGFPNGMVWTQSNIKSGSFFSIANANGIWVASSCSGKGLYYSIDGKTWTQSNITSNSFSGIANANGIWVADSYNNNKGLYYSTDGKTWTQSNITTGSSYSSYISNANGIWVAGRNDGLYYSTDGKTWVQSNITTGDYRNPINANGMWVAGSDGKGLWYSTDGKTWVQSNIIRGDHNQVAYNGGLWLSSSTFGFVYSTDGKNWITTSVLDGRLNPISYGNGVWVAGEHYYRNGLYYSIDGKTWTQSNIKSGSFFSIVNANGIWVASSDTYSSGTGLYYSIDGKTWAQSNITSNNFSGIANANGIWVASSYGYSGLYYSVSWEPHKGG